MITLLLFVCIIINEIKIYPPPPSEKSEHVIARDKCIILLTIGVMLGIIVNCDGRERLLFCCS